MVEPWLPQGNGFNCLSICRLNGNHNYSCLRIVFDYLSYIIVKKGLNENHIYSFGAKEVYHSFCYTSGVEDIIIDGYNFPTPH